VPIADQLNNELVPRQLPPHVVAPEVAASARDVIAGRELTEIGLLAINEAKLQLEVERDAIRGTTSRRRLDHVAALAQSDGNSLQLAALALEHVSHSRTSKEPVDQASSRLDEIVCDLDLLQGGDLEAARRIDAVFDAIVERVLAPAATYA
jgi:hypothetical protein